MKYYIIAGEASGDLHGANLIRAIKTQDPEAQFRFWGGDRMAAEAGTPVRHIRDLAFMGYVEVITHLRTIGANIRFCKADIVAFNPDVCVFIDYPGFNLGIAEFTHRQGFKNVYYISPQVWAWKQGRLRTMRENLDCLCYILPSERLYFAGVDMPQARYVGHPLLDEVDRFRGEVPSTRADGLEDRPVIALLPGSRKQEIRRMLPLMVSLANRHPEYRFKVAAMSLLGAPFYQGILSKMSCVTNNIDLCYDQTYAILSQSYAAVVCSGTATLETALFGVPQMVCYKANALSVAIARRLVHIKYISLVNLTADAPVVKELIQNDFNMDEVERHFADITIHDDTRSKIIEGYNHVVEILGNKGASMRTALAIGETIGGKNGNESV